MSYFADNYLKVSYPIADTGPGLYNAQLGAIHAIGSHFTISDEPVVITMPTGSGKTAVLMMAPYILKCTRALIVTPSVMVRDQIREDVEHLDTLIGAAVLPPDIQKPKVRELRTRIDNLDEWKALSEFDAVVTTPNCASPGYANIPVPPIGLFDVLLIDEAHHSPATTWANLIAAFPNAKTILFTATPYRRDRAELKGKFIYSYPIARAYKDKIFGQITFLPVDAPPNAADNDLAIAKAAEAALNEDRNAGFNHRLMVRTDGKPRAEQLAKLYQTKTSLKLELIHSGHSTLHDAFIDELRDTYDAEKQLTKALPKLAKAATNTELQAAFEGHLKETQGQIARLEQVFESLDEKVRGKHCDGIAGIIEEGKSSWKRTSMRPRWTPA